MTPSSQVFVESLDKAFENVCELDLVFHFDEVGSSHTHQTGVYVNDSKGTSHTRRGGAGWFGVRDKRRRDCLSQ